MFSTNSSIANTALKGLLTLLLLGGGRAFAQTLITGQVGYSTAKPPAVGAGICRATSKDFNFEV
jgi:hypothetical protein